jgi:hypothetical protein
MRSRSNTPPRSSTSPSSRLPARPQDGPMVRIRWRESPTFYAWIASGGVDFLELPPLCSSKRIAFRSGKLGYEYKASGKEISGCWLKKHDAGIEHINGNCLISINFWRRCKGIFWPDMKGGWDATLRHHMLPVSHPSKLIWSDYQLGMPHNPWKGCDYLWAPKRFNDPANALYGQDLFPCWYHGVKVIDGLECVRNRLINES